MSLQTFSKESFEVIIVLNGCGEPWKSEIERLINEYLSDNHVRFICIADSGVSNARNIALDNTKGEYITFLDDDDIITPQYLQQLYSISGPECVGLSNSLSFIDGTNIYDNDYQQHLIFERLHKKAKNSLTSVRAYFNGPVMKLIHRDIIGDRRFDCRFANGEDSLFMALISDRIKNCKFTGEQAVYLRRFRESSATTRRRSRAEIARNSARLMGMYTLYFFRHPLGYSPSFYLTRYLAAIKNILV